ncbi:MAG: hypothetical protein ACRCXZ_07465 [Patescibacteria group bacterium]
MKSLIRIFFISFLLVPILMGPLAFAQTNNSSTQQQGQVKMVDDKVNQDNVLIERCRLTYLSNGSNAVTQEKKGEFLKGCIQGAIRIFIVFALVAAIFNLALNGVNQMMPFGGGDATKKSISQLRNLVIGLFLIIVGWNIIPILNASFNNTNFLTLPSTDPCQIKNACETKEKTAAREAANAVATFEKLIKENKYSGSSDQQEKLTTKLQEFCNQKDKKYLEEFKNRNLDQSKFCPDLAKKIDKINKIANNGAASPDIEGLKEYNKAIETLKKLKSEGKAKTDSSVFEAANELGSACSEGLSGKFTDKEGTKTAQEFCKRMAVEGDERGAGDPNKIADWYDKELKI